MPRPEPDQVIAQICSANLGLVTRQQAVTAGLSYAQIRHRVRLGRWEQLRTGVYRLAGGAAHSFQELAAAVIASGGAASHRSAALLLDIVDEAPPRHEITVPRSAGHHLDGVRLHRTTDLASKDTMSIQGVRSTNAIRTIIDLGDRLSVEDLGRATDAAIHRRLVHPDPLIRRFLQLQRRGRRGVATVRAVLVELDPTLAPVESDLESLLLQLIRRAGLPEPITQHGVVIDDHGYRLDMAYPDDMIAIEADGFATHGTQHAFESDRERRNRLTTSGWVVLNFTWKQICRQPEYVVEQVGRALADPPERPATSGRQTRRGCT